MAMMKWIHKRVRLRYWGWGQLVNTACKMWDAKGTSTRWRNVTCVDCLKHQPKGT